MNEDARINAMIAALFCDRESDGGRYDLSTPRIVGGAVYAADGFRAVRIELESIFLDMFSRSKVESQEHFPNVASVFSDRVHEFGYGNWQKMSRVSELMFCDDRPCRMLDGVPIQDRFVLPLYFARDCEFRAMSDMVLFRWPGCQAMIMRYGQ